MRKLKIWNGRGCNIHGVNYDTFYVCAYSQKDAVELIREAGCGSFNLSEIQVYYSPDCWGNSMEGVVRERGLWATVGYPEKPKKIA